MSKKKLITISRSGDNVTFYFDDSSTLICEISGTPEGTFLYYPGGHNATVFFELGIDDPHQLYKDLGIYTCDGDCPECRREDLDKVFNYLLENYSAGPEEPETPKEPSEWDWLLN